MIFDKNTAKNEHNEIIKNILTFISTIYKVKITRLCNFRKT